MSSEMRRSSVRGTCADEVFFEVGEHGVQLLESHRVPGKRCSAERPLVACATYSAVPTTLRPSGKETSRPKARGPSEALQWQLTASTGPRRAAGGP